MKKETLYIDVEDDITAVIEKIMAVKEKIIAVVPPKRSGVLSSVVNLKLVNKSAHDAGKRVVLITTDKTLVSLAGGVGMYVAPNLQSAPAIPAVAPPPEDMPSEIISEGGAETAVGATASTFQLKRPTGDARPARDSDVSATVDTTQLPEEATAKAEKGKKKLKIPNFGLFKKRLLLIILGIILLIGGSVWAFYLAPSAHISLEGQTNRIATDTSFTVDTTLTEANFEKKELPAASKELKKEVSESFTPTGEKNVGKTASGTVRIVNCSEADKLGDVVRTVSAGTAVTRNGHNFITQAAVDVEPSSFSEGNCQKNKPSTPVAVVADQSGGAYNHAASSAGAYDYGVSGKPTMSASGSAMGGGTDEVVKVIIQEDVEKAREAALVKLREGAQDGVITQFPPEVFVIVPSFTEIVTEVTPSVPVGERADTASVKVAATFFALGVNKDVMTEFLKGLQKPSLETNQAIFNTGLDTAIITKLEAPVPSRQVFNLKTDAFAGPDVNLDELRTLLAGKSFGESKTFLESLPGVTKAEIDLSPFWVFSMPRREGKITIDIKVN